MDFRLEVHHVIGSGTRGYSYITDRHGYLFQTAISWFSQKHIWDKSPGFLADRFAGRPIVEACLFCHANRAPAMEGYRNRYEHPSQRVTPSAANAATDRGRSMSRKGDC